MPRIATGPSEAQEYFPVVATTDKNIVGDRGRPGSALGRPVVKQFFLKLVDFGEGSGGTRSVNLLFKCLQVLKHHIFYSYS